MNRKIFQKRIMFFLVVAFFIIAIILVGNSISGLANTSQDFNHFKYYTSIEIQDGDSLWAIASEYMTSEYVALEYGNIEEYMNEIRTLNKLRNDIIHTGEYLTIPYYSNELF